MSRSKITSIPSSMAPRPTSLLQPFYLFIGLVGPLRRSSCPASLSRTRQKHQTDNVARSASDTRDGEEIFWGTRANRSWRMPGFRGPSRTFEIHRAWVVRCGATSRPGAPLVLRFSGTLVAHFGIFNLRIFVWARCVSVHMIINFENFLPDVCSPWWWNS